MRNLLLVIWLVLPVGVGAYHFGPGQDRETLDEVAELLAKADRAAAQEQWLEAEKNYDEALAKLPSDTTDAERRIRLERAKAQMFVKKLPVAHRDLIQLVDELQEADDVDAELLADARSSLANAQYYMTWLMRLEGEPEERWRPEIESARQIYRLLAESSESDGAADAAAKHREDLESAIRLARMDIGDLQGLPLPSQ